MQVWLSLGLLKKKPSVEFQSKLNNPAKGVIKKHNLAFSGFELDNIQRVRILRLKENDIQISKVTCLHKSKKFHLIGIQNKITHF